MTFDRTMVIKLVLEYNGKEFFGWQVQPGRRTVQGEILKALSVLLKEKNFNLIGASRTDRGVHAEAQVASLHLKGDLGIELQDFRRSLNGILPRDIYVKEAVEAPPDFHARYKARAKIYRYRVLKGRSPIRKDFVWEFPFDYNSRRLRDLPVRIIGTHDFSYLCSGVPKGEGVVRVRSACWTRRGDEFHFVVEADRFLYRMVRILVGLMMKISSGRGDPSMLEDAISGKEMPKVWLAPPQGLTLVKVLYQI